MPFSALKEMTKAKCCVIEDSIEVLYATQPPFARLPVTIKQEVVVGTPEKLLHETDGFASVTPDTVNLGSVEGQKMASFTKPSATSGHAKLQKIPAPHQGREVPCLIPDLVVGQKKWSLQAMVLEKSPIRQFNTGKGSGDLFSLKLKDKDGNTIKATFFDASTSFWHSLIEQGKPYLFTKGNIKIVDPEYQVCSSNMEIIFHVSSNIKPITLEEVDQELLASKPKPSPADAVPTAFVSIQDLNLTVKKPSICVKVIKKGPITWYKNGNGKVQNVTFFDEAGWDIRCAMFQETLDKFMDVLEVGKVYAISGFKIVEAKPMYNTCKSTFELILGLATKINFMEDGPDIPDKVPNYIPFADISCTGEDESIDVLAVVKRIGNVIPVVCNDDRETVKCDLTLTDQSDREVFLTLWGNKAEEAAEKFHDDPVVSFTDVSIKEYNYEIYLKCKGDITVKPDTEKARKLQKWWTLNGKVGK